MQDLARLKSDVIWEDIKIQVTVKFLNLFASSSPVVRSRSHLFSLPPRDCAKDFFWTNDVATISWMIIWDPLHDVWFLHFYRRLWGKGQLFKMQKSALLMVAFKEEYCHLEQRWSVVLSFHEDQPQLKPPALSSHRFPLRGRRTFRSLQPGTLKQMLIVQG